MVCMGRMGSPVFTLFFLGPPGTPQMICIFRQKKAWEHGKLTTLWTPKKDIAEGWTLNTERSSLNRGKMDKNWEESTGPKSTWPKAYLSSASLFVSLFCTEMHLNTTFESVLACRGTGFCWPVTTCSYRPVGCTVHTETDDVSAWVWLEVPCVSK